MSANGQHVRSMRKFEGREAASVSTSMVCFRDASSPLSSNASMTTTFPTLPPLHHVVCGLERVALLDTYI